jgi:carbamoyl-phosphate synthase small subunit
VIHIRNSGALRGVIRSLDTNAMGDLALAGWIAGFEGSPEDSVSSDVLADFARQAQDIPTMEGLDLATLVSTDSIWTDGPEDAEKHVVAMDFGMKMNIVRQLIGLGCRVTVVPADTSAESILALDPDGVLLSNGPGDPEPVTAAIETIHGLLGKVPIFGICLGHQLLGIACGAATYKLKFGHRGGNHPVRELEGGRVEITAQNHGFAINPASLDGREVTVTHMNLNDDTIAGIRHRRYPAFSVQFHPEASPGPHDSHHLFHRFVALMERGI